VIYEDAPTAISTEESGTVEAPEAPESDITTEDREA